MMIFILFFSSLVHSASFTPVEKPGAPNYWDKGACELAERMDCFDKGEEDVRWLKVETQMQDDPSRPIYRAIEKSPVLIPCADEPLCREIIIKNPCTGDEAPKWDAVKNHPEVGSIGKQNFVWCELIVGYEKKAVKVALVDDAKKKDIIAAEEKARQEQIAEAARRASIAKSIADKPVLEGQDLQDAIKLLIKEYMEKTRSR